jgi:hypothetical protein
MREADVGSQSADTIKLSFTRHSGTSLRWRSLADHGLAAATH